MFGCGYLGIRVAESLVFSGIRVWATTRNPDKADRLSQMGITPVLADWCEPTTLGKLPQVGRLLVSVSYDRGGGRTRSESQLGGLSNLMDVLPPSTRVCYISTTGVYHQTDGSWVDESSETRPTREGGQIHLDAEKRLLATRPSGSVVLRLAGIYGPGRVPRAADVMAGRPIASREDGFLNLIHVEDAATAAIQSWHDPSHPLYLISDDHPVRRGDFYREIASQTNSPEPTFVAPGDGSSKSARSDSNKRVRNRRMKADLLPELRYPTYREGLTDVLKSYS